MAELKLENCISRVRTLSLCYEIRFKIRILFAKLHTHAGCKEGIYNILTLLNSERQSRLLNNFGLIFLTLIVLRRLLIYRKCSSGNRIFNVTCLGKIWLKRDCGSCGMLRKKCQLPFIRVTYAATVVCQGRLNRGADAAEIGKTVHGLCLHNLIKEISH